LTEYKKTDSARLFVNKKRERRFNQNLLTNQRRPQSPLLHNPLLSFSLYLKVLAGNAVGEEEEELPFELLQLLLPQELQDLLQLIHEQHLRTVKKGNEAKKGKETKKKD
jgi:hypothetical protein